MRILPLPRWSVTWPTRPSGTYTQYVRATSPVDAVRVAARLDWPTTAGYSVAFDYVPEVWRLRHPYRLRSRHVQGPEFSDPLLNELTFVPMPLDLKGITAETEGRRDPWSTS